MELATNPKIDLLKQARAEQALRYHKLLEKQKSNPASLTPKELSDLLLFQAMAANGEFDPGLSVKQLIEKSINRILSQPSTEQSPSLE